MKTIQENLGSSFPLDGENKHAGFTTREASWDELAPSSRHVHRISISAQAGPARRVGADRSARSLLTFKACPSQVERAWPFRHIQNAQPRAKGIANHSTVSNRNRKRGDKNLAALLSQVLYCAYHLIDQVMNFYRGRNSRIVMQHNFGVGLWDPRSNGAVTTPLWTQAKGLDIVGCGGASSGSGGASREETALAASPGCMRFSICVRSSAAPSAGGGGVRRRAASDR